MAGAFDEAQSEQDAAKAAALAALARGGSQALGEHNAAVEQIAAMKRQAATGALERAAAIGGGDAQLALNEGGHLAGRSEAIAGMSPSNVYDRYSQDQQRAGSARQQALADLAAGHASYFDKVSAARPIAEGLARAQAAKKAEQDMLSDAELAKRLMGEAEVRAATAPHQPVKSILGFKVPQLSQTSRARSIGVEAGLDPARVYGVLPEEKPAAPKAKPGASSILSNMKAQEELDARAARLNLIETAKRAAGKATFFELERAIDVGEAAFSAGDDGMAAADAYVDTLSDDYLKRNGISKAKLRDWIRRYGEI